MDSLASFDIFVLVVCVAALYLGYRVAATWIDKTNQEVRDGLAPGTPLTPREIRGFALVSTAYLALPILLVLYLYWRMRLSGAASVFSTFLHALDIAIMSIVFFVALFWATTKLTLAVYNALFFPWFARRNLWPSSRAGVVAFLLFALVLSGMIFLLTRPLVQLLLYGSYDPAFRIRGLSEVFLHIYHVTDSWGITQLVRQVVAIVVTLAPVLGAVAAIISAIKNSLDILDRLRGTSQHQTASTVQGVKPNDDRRSNA